MLYFFVRFKICQFKNTIIYKFYNQNVLNLKTMEATTLHMAAGGGHAKIVKILLENGAKPEDENAVKF